MNKVSSPSVTTLTFLAASASPPALTVNNLAATATGSSRIACVTGIPAFAKNSRDASAPIVTTSSSNVKADRRMTEIARIVERHGH